MIKRRWFASSFRCPKTKQELRANQDRKDPYVRAKRRNIPTAWDDKFIRVQKSWKYLGRKHQWEESHYQWHEFSYSWRDEDKCQVMIAHEIIDWILRTGYYYETTCNGFKWLGPAWWVKGYCHKCYNKLNTEECSKCKMV